MIIISNLEFYGFHGVSDEEQKIGHRYSVDIEIEGLFEAEFTDRIADTIDYGALSEKIMEVVQGNQVRTLERLSRKIAEHLLENFAMIESMNLKVTKLLPPAPFVIGAASYQQLYIRE